ncbi:NAD-dependent epimerase/dehydratase family protein [Candidatus Daviesbacteria bacterium]|nr:NAD-dependent epimerase/dehydratase family protein [Candidatus Daviesbacteria bacterium]
MRYLVTGGAGFIGSHVVDKLLKDSHMVRVYDNFSTGRKIFIQDHFKKKNFELIDADLSNKKILMASMEDIDFVFHLAAHADVRSGINNRFIDHEENLEITHNILEAMCKNKIKQIAFSSTSSVYGDATIHPTPEDYPFHPTSLYGATKAACESYIHAYSSYYDFQSYIFRFVSFLGPRYTHGIIFDVLKKLQQNSKSIKLLSDGSPKKSSLSVFDGIEAMFKIIEKSKDQINIYNIGHTEILTVSEIVNTILQTVNLNRVKKIWLGKESNWKGDNEFVLLSINKLKRLGWKPKKSIKEAITETVLYLTTNPK